MSIQTITRPQNSVPLPPSHTNHLLDSELYEGVYSHPLSLLHDHSLTYAEKVQKLKTWRDERTKFLLECCRDMDYINDWQIEYVLQALREIRKEPRRFQ